MFARFLQVLNYDGEMLYNTLSLHSYRCIYIYILCIFIFIHTKILYYLHLNRGWYPSDVDIRFDPGQTRPGLHPQELSEVDMFQEHFEEHVQRSPALAFMVLPMGKLVWSGPFVLIVRVSAFAETSPQDLFLFNWWLYIYYIPVAKTKNGWCKNPTVVALGNRNLIMYILIFTTINFFAWKGRGSVGPQTF